MRDIVPFNRNEVLARLPLQEPSGTTNVDNENDTITAGAAVSDAVLKHLKTMRYGGDGDQPTRRKRSKVSVEPGCSIAYEELDAGDKGPKSGIKSSSKKKPCKRQSTAQRKREQSVEPSDDGSSAASDDDSVRRQHGHSILFFCRQASLRKLASTAKADSAFSSSGFTKWKNGVAAFSRQESTAAHHMATVAVTSVLKGENVSQQLFRSGRNNQETQQ